MVSSSQGPLNVRNWGITRRGEITSGVAAAAAAAATELDM